MNFFTHASRVQFNLNYSSSLARKTITSVRKIELWIQQCAHFSMLNAHIVYHSEFNHIKFRSSGIILGAARRCVSLNCINSCWREIFSSRNFQLPARWSPMHWSIEVLKYNDMLFPHHKHYFWVLHTFIQLITT